MLVWSKIFEWAISLFKREAGGAKATAETGGSSQAINRSSFGGDFVGRDKNVYQAATDPLPAWPLRPNCPQFRISLAGPEPINGSVTVTTSEMPSEIEVRWVGADVATKWIKPKPDGVANNPHVKKFHLPPVTIPRENEYETVTFEISFYLSDGKHGGRWNWPLRKHPKGHWDLRADLGSGVFQPEETW
jgi:hypothetical protein